MGDGEHEQGPQDGLGDLNRSSTNTTNMNKPKTQKTQKTRVRSRPACVLFSVRDANETDVAVMKKLADAGCEIVVVQEAHFDAAFKAIEAVRRRTPNEQS